MIGLCIFLLVSESRRQRESEPREMPLSNVPLSMSLQTDSTMVSSKYGQSLRSGLSEGFSDDEGGAMPYKYKSAAEKYNRSFYGYDAGGPSRYETSA